MSSDLTRSLFQFFGFFTAAPINQFFDLRTELVEMPFKLVTMNSCVLASPLSLLEFSSLTSL